MEQNIKDAIEEYYRLKQAYDGKFNQEKRTILNNDRLNKKSMRKALSKITRKCVSCGKSGGTSFTQEDRLLRASCNAVSQCSLDMEIDIGEYEHITAVKKSFSEFYEDSRTDIIKTKLNMLFGYITEEEAAEIFAVQKDEYDISKRNMKMVDERITDTLHSGRNKKDIETITNDIGTIKERISDYIKLYNDTSSPSIITDIIDTYINDLYPETLKLRTTVYVKNEIECSDGTVRQGMCENGIYKLVQEPYLYSEAEIEHGEPAIIKNNK